ncbi:uncharacterized protein [Macrobrachium rosenbergii]|uniref:uncharacterized protein n=1 Tax=Macrobrachium rosenbergii TaxID=79674 RepID=UPI0034D579DB
MPLHPNHVALSKVYFSSCPSTVFLEPTRHCLEFRGVPIALPLYGSPCISPRGRNSSSEIASHPRTAFYAPSENLLRPKPPLRAAGAMSQSICVGRTPPAPKEGIKGKKPTRSQTHAGWKIWSELVKTSSTPGPIDALASQPRGPFQSILFLVPFDRIPRAHTPLLGVSRSPHRLAALRKPLHLTTWKKLVLGNRKSSTDRLLHALGKSAKRDPIVEASRLWLGFPSFIQST